MALQIELVRNIGNYHSDWSWETFETIDFESGQVDKHTHIYYCPRAIRLGFNYVPSSFKKLILVMYFFVYQRSNLQFSTIGRFQKISSFWTAVFVVICSTVGINVLFGAGKTHYSFWHVIEFCSNINENSVNLICG